MSQDVRSSYDTKTREIIHKLLTRILKVSDSYEKHKDLDYKPFLGIQLELLKQIIATESDIRAQKKLQNQEMLEEARKRRRLLKVLGSTVAWVLLDFDRPYIRTFSRNLDPGFISGKEGLKLEMIALRASFSRPNCAGVLHDITNCLRIGDLSMIGPNHSIRTVELKIVKNEGKMGGRDHRQYARGRDIREFYDTGRSTKITPGLTTIRHIARKRDRHNWQQLCHVIRKAEKYGIATKMVEKCLTYCVFKANIKDHVLEKTAKTTVARFRKRSDATVGFLSEQFSTPTILPVTCFNLPRKYKEQILFGDIGVCVFVDLRRLAETLTFQGFPSKVIRDRTEGLLRTKFSNVVAPIIMKEGLLVRLLYEFASVETITGYMRDMNKRAKELILQNENV